MTTSLAEKQRAVDENYAAFRRSSQNF